MRRIKNQGAQGDLLFRRVDAIPAKAERVADEDGRHVLAHSETGHHHWTSAEGAEFWREPGDPLIAYLRVHDDATVEHARSWDTHAPIVLPAGVWELRRQREYTPEGWRRVED